MGFEVCGLVEKFFFFDTCGLPVVGRAHCWVFLFAGGVLHHIESGFWGGF